MKLSQRMLTKWRKEALRENLIPLTESNDQMAFAHDSFLTELNNRILRLTQELLDQHLLRK